MNKRRKRPTVPEPGPQVPLKIWLLVALSGGLLIFSGVKFWLSGPASPAQLLAEASTVEKHDPKQSERLLQMAVTASGGWGTFPDAEVALCRRLAMRNAWGEAKAIYATLDKQTCRDESLLEFGRLALTEGHLETGRDALQQLSQRDGPTKLKALETLMTHHQERGETSEAVTVARQLLRIRPEPRYHWAHVQLLKEAERHEECRDALYDAIQHCTARGMQEELRFLLVERLLILGDLVAARKEFTALETLDGASPRFKATAADLYRLDGEPEKALATIDGLIAAEPSLPVAHLTRGVVLLDLGRYQEAVNNLQQTVQLDPHDERAQSKLAEAYRALGDLKEAQKHQKVGQEIHQKRLKLRTLRIAFASHPSDTQLAEEIAALQRSLGQEKVDVRCLK